MYVLLMAFVLVLLLIGLHLRPLTPKEVRCLGRRRRARSLEAYFRADDTERTVNPEFKKSLNPRGVFYAVDLPLYTTASTVAGLLKYKKHEWIVVAFESEKRVALLWVNKGHNNSSVSILLPLELALQTAMKHGYTSALVFHNHPNSDPSRYNCTEASQTDLDTASLWARTLNPAGVNLVEYVCERGRHYCYFQSPSEHFMPLSGFVADVHCANGISWIGDLRLHAGRVL